jgi:hypothetical protein
MTRQPSVPDRAFIAALFIAGLGLRWLFADGDLVGDDAWYLYLSRTFGTESAARGEHPWFHIANRPLYYATYHVSTYAGLFGFRLLGCVIGAALPVLSFGAARRAGATFAAAASAAAVLCLQAQQLKYSALGFPDALAAAFALAACWALAAESLGWALTLSAACVAAKESFIAVPVLIAFLHLTSGRSRLRPRHWLALALPLLYVAAVALLPRFDKALRMQGWSNTPFTLNLARNMWVGPELWPLIAWLAWKRQAQLLALWLALPAFYLMWTVLLGRGVAPWYVLGPAALASVAVAHALDFVYRECTQRLLAPVTRIAVVGLCVCCFAPLPLYGLSRTRTQLAHLDGRLPVPSAAPQVVTLIERASPQQLLLINCFWAFGYSHLRSGKPADSTWWHRAEDAEYVLKRARAASMVVVCHDAEHPSGEQQLRQLPRELLLDDGAYLVLGEKKR